MVTGECNLDAIRTVHKAIVELSIVAKMVRRAEI